MVDVWRGGYWGHSCRAGRRLAWQLMTHGRHWARVAERLHKARLSPFPNIGLDRYDGSSWPSGKAMRQRSRAGGKTAKARGGKVAQLRRRNAPKPMRARKSSTAGQEREIVRLTRELHDA